MATVTRTRTCNLCEANCGLLVELEGRTARSIRGDPDHVLSRGHVCPKATALADLQTDPDRLRRPMRRDGDRFVEASWEDAFQDIAERFSSIGAGALYLGNPNVHNYGIGTQIRALKKALGARGIYTASTLDQIPQQLVQMWMYGHNALFPVPDVDRTHTLVMVGANPLASNGSVWTVPGVKGRLKALQRRGGRVVVVDPRRTETAELADEHHFVRPGTDPALLLGLLVALDEAGLVNPGRLEPMLTGFETARAAWRTFRLAELSAACGVPEAALRSIAEAIGGPEPAIVYGRVGVSTQPYGTLNLWLVQLLNIATGNLDRVGGAMFSTPAIDVVASTGPGSYGRFTSRVGGRPEVLSEWPTATLADEILTPGEGRVRALFTVAGNPVLSAPNGHRLDEALAQLDLMVSVDMYVTETSRHAHWVLPPCGPLEKDHYPLFLGPIAVRNYACYSPPLLEKEDGTLADWEIVRRLAGALGRATGRRVPTLPTPREVLDVGLRSSGHQLTLADVEAAPHGVDLGPLEPRLPDRLFTEDRRIHCAPAKCVEDLERFRAALGERPEGLVLIGRRHLRSNNSWLHNARRLVKGPDRCTLMIHPTDAAARDVRSGAEVEVVSRVGAVRLPAEVTDAIMPGTVSIPHGFGHGRPGTGWSVARAHAGVSINDLSDHERLDPLSGNAAFNGTPVEVRPL